MVRLSNSTIPSEYKDVEVGSHLKEIVFSNGTKPDTIELVKDSVSQDKLIHWIYESVVKVFDPNKHKNLTDFIGEISGRQFYKG